jgi:hypothetical protein
MTKKSKPITFGTSVEFFDIKSKDENGIIRRSEKFTHIEEGRWVSDQRHGTFKQVFVPLDFEHKKIVIPNQY